MSQTAKRTIWIVITIIAVLLGILASAARVSGVRAALSSPSEVRSYFSSAFSSLFNRDEKPFQEAPLYRPVADYESAVIEAVEKAAPSVVSITISKNVPVYENCRVSPFFSLPPELEQLFGGSSRCPISGTELRNIGGGSGFIISKEGLILTNKHVVSDTEAAYTVFMNDGTKRSAQVLARDPIQDLAIIKIDGGNLPVITLGNSDDLKLGQSVVAIGNALGEFSNTVGVGVVSGLARSITAFGEGSSETLQGLIQTDAAINPGNSGGPLINLRGEVVGVNVAVVQGAENIAFALPINWAKQDIETVLGGKTLTAPYLGLRYAMLTPEIARQRNLKENYGALITSPDSGDPVIKDSPAEKAGLKEGDIIKAINGDSLEGKDLLNYIRGKQPGDKLDMLVMRDGKERHISVTLGSRTE